MNINSVFSGNMNRELTFVEKNEIETQIYSGVASRSSFVSLFLAFASSLYGFTSFELFRTFDSQISLWSNLWPRILFNGIPFFCLFAFLKWKKVDVKTRSFVWAAATPVIFMAACFIHAWPIIISGQYHLYAYVHGANIFIFTIGLVAVAPPPKVITLHTMMYAIFFLIPVCMMLSRVPIVLRFILNDFLIAGCGSIIASYLIHKLRMKLITMIVVIKSDISQV